MRTVAIIQARIGSTRLPGKVLLPLGDTYVLNHIIRRVKTISSIDKVVTAIPDTEANNVVEFFAERSGTATYRGPEDDVLGRMFDAATVHDADVVVRVSADNPLIPPAYIEYAADLLKSQQLDYVTPSFEHEFPPGTACEIMSLDSMRTVVERATKSEAREHVTLYYRDNPDDFEYINLTPSDVPGCEMLNGRDDIRLTLDRAADYRLIRQIYESVSFDGILPLEAAIECIDKNNLAENNRNQSQHNR